ncbi:MAG: arsenate reductase [Methylophagaceae bacterium]|jgi:arsenate reductase
MSRIRVLFLSTGNACRSQMAEAWAKDMASDLIDVKSAGIEVQGLNKMAVAVMSEANIDMSGQIPARVNVELLEWADMIVTLCDNVEEQCPVVSFETLKLHLPLSNPAKFKGNDEAILAAFKQTRDKIKLRVEYVLTQLPVPDC